MMQIHAPFWSAAAAGGGDPYWSDVLLLCLMEGSGSTVIDSSPYARTITANGTPDTLSIPVTQGAGNFPDFPSLQVTVNASPDDPVDWTVAQSTDFSVPQLTVEYFWYQTSSSGHTQCPLHIAMSNSSSVNQFFIGTYVDTGRFTYAIGTEAQNNQAVGSLTFGDTHHCAIVIDTDADTVSIWIDGTRVVERTGLTIGPDIEKITLMDSTIGPSSVAYTYEVSQIRVTAAARYSGATITVPTGPFPTA
jgi:hypothetical protein